MIGILLLSLIINANCNCNNIIEMCNEIKKDNNCNSIYDVEELSRILLNDEESSFSYDNDQVYSYDNDKEIDVNTPIIHEEKDLSFKPFNIINHSILLLILMQ